MKMNNNTYYLLAIVSILFYILIDDHDHPIHSPGSCRYDSRLYRYSLSLSLSLVPREWGCRAGQVYMTTRKPDRPPAPQSTVRRGALRILGCNDDKHYCNLILLMPIAR